MGIFCCISFIIITEIRRCGKSFLLFVLFKKYLLESSVDNDHIIEIALDGIENEDLRDPRKCYQYIKGALKDDKKYDLLLDEVQFMPRFEEQKNNSCFYQKNNNCFYQENNNFFYQENNNCFYWKHNNCFCQRYTNPFFKKYKNHLY